MRFADYTPLNVVALGLAIGGGGGLRKRSSLP